MRKNNLVEKSMHVSLSLFLKVVAADISLS